MAKKKSNKQPLKKLKKNYVWWAVVATLVQYGLPITYIIWAYDIFEFEESGNSLTGWGIIIIAIIITLLKNKIQDFIVDYNSHLSATAKRGKWGFVFLIVGLFLMLAQYWLQNTLIFFLVLGFSNLISLIFYAPYDKQKTEYIELKEAILEKQREEKIKGITI